MPRSKKSWAYSYRHRGWDFPTVAFFHVIHDQMIKVGGGRPGVHSEAALESAEHKPVDSAFGEDAYPTLFGKVAAVGYTLAHDHVFNDANKRTAVEVMQACLAWNGYYRRPNEVAMATVVILVAAGHTSISGLRLALIHMYGLDTSDATL